jgi:hypothetical protein
MSASCLCKKASSIPIRGDAVMLLMFKDISLYIPAILAKEIGSGANIVQCHFSDCH